MQEEPIIIDGEGIVASQEDQQQPSSSSSSQQSSSSSQPSSSPPQPSHKVAAWLHNNILDYVLMKDIKTEIMKRGIDLKGPKTPFDDDNNVMATISNGVQMHLKNIIDLSMTTARRRNDFSTYVVFDQIKRILKDNDGYPTPALKEGFCLGFDNDYYSNLQYQEDVAKNIIEKKKADDENIMRREMLNYDIERSKLSIYKRKHGDDIPWWIRERACEENGTLKWEELAVVHGHDRIASKYRLGSYKKGKLSSNDIDSYFFPSTVSFNDTEATTIPMPTQSNTKCPLHGTKSLTSPLPISVNDVHKNINQFKKDKRVMNANKMEVEALLKFGLIPRVSR